MEHKAVPQAGGGPAGKVALVAGAIRGIGLAIAESLARNGTRLVLTYYDWLDDLDTMHRTMKEAGAEYEAVHADLRREEDAAEAVRAAVERFGRLDILINNIERGGWPVVHGPYTKRQWDLEFDTTVTAKWNLFNAAFRHLQASGAGCVVNISSISAEIGRAGPAAVVFNDCYSLSNRAVGALTRQWARLGAPKVRVNELMLGFFDTRHGPGTRGWGLLSEEQKQAIIDHTLLRRTGRLEDAAKAVDFMVFNAPFMTGAVIRLDGGYLLGGEDVPEMPKGVVGPDEPTFGGSRRPGADEG